MVVAHIWQPAPAHSMRHLHSGVGTTPAEAEGGSSLECPILPLWLALNLIDQTELSAEKV